VAVVQPHSSRGRGSQLVLARIAAAVTRQTPRPIARS
jgi:hypothetical protein